MSAEALRSACDRFFNDPCWFTRQAPAGATVVLRWADLSAYLVHVIRGLRALERAEEEHRVARNRILNATAVLHLAQRNLGIGDFARAERDVRAAIACLTAEGSE